MPPNWAGLQYPAGAPLADPILVRNWLLDQAAQRSGTIGPTDPAVLMAQAQQRAGSLGPAPPPLSREQEVLRSLTQAVQQGQGFGMTGAPALGYLAGNALVRVGHPEAAGWAMTGSMAADAALSAGAPMGPRNAVSRLVQMGRSMGEKMPIIDPDALNRALVENRLPYRPQVDAVEPARLGTGYQPGEALAPGPYLPAGQHASESTPDLRQPRFPRVGKFVHRMPVDGKMKTLKTQDAYLAQAAVESNTFDEFLNRAAKDYLDFEGKFNQAAKRLKMFGGPGGEMVTDVKGRHVEEVVRLGVVGDFIKNPALRAQVGREALAAPVVITPAGVGVMGASSGYFGSPVLTSKFMGQADWNAGLVVLSADRDMFNQPTGPPKTQWRYNRQAHLNETNLGVQPNPTFLHETEHAVRESKGRGFGFTDRFGTDWERRPEEHAATRAQEGFFSLLDLTHGRSGDQLRKMYDDVKTAQASGKLVLKDVRLPKGAGERAVSRVRRAENPRYPDSSPALAALRKHPGETLVPITAMPGVQPAIRLTNGEVWLGDVMPAQGLASAQGRPVEPWRTSTGVVYRGRFFREGTATRLGVRGMDQVIRRGEAGPKVNIKNPEALGGQPPKLPPRGSGNVQDFAPPEPFGPGLVAEQGSGMLAEIPSVVPGSTATYPVTSSPYVKPEMRHVEEAIVRRVEADPHGFVDRYLALPEVRKNGGRYVNTDTVRELFPEYLSDRTKNSVLVHEASSAVTKVVLEKLMAEPVAPGRDPVVMFTAGAPGSGKTTAVKAHLKDVSNRADITYDGTLSNPATADRLIGAALNSGRDVHIVFVDTPLTTAFTRAVERSVRQVHKFGSGRVPPISEIVGMYQRIPAGLASLAERWPQEIADGRVRLDVIRADRKNPNRTSLIEGSGRSIDYINKTFVPKKGDERNAERLRTILRRLASAPGFPPGIAEAFDQ